MPAARPGIIFTICVLSAQSKAWLDLSLSSRNSNVYLSLIRQSSGPESSFSLFECVVLVQLNCRYRHTNAPSHLIELQWEKNKKAPSFDSESVDDSSSGEDNVVEVKLGDEAIIPPTLMSEKKHFFREFGN